ncbi:NUDIX hydrolase [Alishewanella longhuensis]|uniref:NUDIX hydrolase n=1 Tax=Alishewanella longhuensis TaxID=1091037 RepID=A0ABQ3KZ72_9ALTE|nr:NUDIX domain-containing protein [Alishewanella longhuensis]GHG71827.1 NUDIX hydrolase [Alishewanella longhuensis]
MSRNRLHLTVAAVIVFDNKFLLVEERDKLGGHRVLNQPAGHMEEDEDVVTAICREVTEETGLVLKPTAWLGLSQLRASNQHTYIRVNFLFEPTSLPAGYQPQDSDILALHWLTEAELAAQNIPVRSQLVTDAIKAYRQDTRLSLELIQPLLTL